MAKKKAKSVNWDRVESPSVLQELTNQLKHHPALEECEIALMWMLGQRASETNRVKATRVISCQEHHTTLHGYDRIIGLNKAWWVDANAQAHAFEMDLALCRIGPKYDAEGEQKSDENGRLVWIKVDPDFDGFEGPIKRHGAQSPELAAAGRVMATAQSTLPFVEALEVADEAVPN